MTLLKYDPFVTYLHDECPEDAYNTIPHHCMNCPYFAGETSEYMNHFVKCDYK